MRYRGQSYEVAVPVPSLRGADDLADLVRRFHDAHRRRYGHMAQAEAVEIVNFQVTAIGRIPKPATEGIRCGDRSRQSRTRRRQAYFNADRCPRRAGLASQRPCSPGMRIEGPAIIEEKTSTTVLYPGQRAEVDVVFEHRGRAAGK